MQRARNTRTFYVVGTERRAGVTSGSGRLQLVAPRLSLSLSLSRRGGKQATEKKKTMSEKAKKTKLTASRPALGEIGTPAAIF